MAIDGSPAVVHAMRVVRSDCGLANGAPLVIRRRRRWLLLTPFVAHLGIRPLALPSLLALSAPVVCHFNVTHSAFKLPEKTTDVNIIVECGFGNGMSDDTDEVVH